jgi:exodeoxyribonuclease V beta subunit
VSADLDTERGWERPRALEALRLDAHGIIEASAGTGKTYTLEHLVLELVAAGAPIEEILVVTFTDKATREMRQRVRARLVSARARVASHHAERLARGEAISGSGRELATRLASAVASFDRASISTIHGFCQRALAEHAFASGRPFSSERADGRESFGRAVRQAVRIALGSGAPGHASFRAALAAFTAMGGEGAVGRLESLLYTWLREPGEVRPAFDPVVAAGALLAMPNASELVGARWAELLATIPSLTARARVRDALIDLATSIAPHVAELASRLASATESAGVEDPAEAAVWGPALAWAARSTDPRGLESNAALLVRHLGQHAHVLEAAPSSGLAGGGPAPTLGASLRTLHHALGSPVPYLLHAILPRVRALWVREKREAGTLDFDDMLTALRDAIAADPGVRRAIRARYRHALVDEFQDTDDVQWEIFRRLFVDRAEGDEEPRRTLVVIGDAKQAIYGFRSADVHTFEDACRVLEREGASSAILGESYRSSAALLTGLDRIFAPRTDDAALGRGLAGYAHALSPGVPERRAWLPAGETAGAGATPASGDTLASGDTTTPSEAPAIVVQHIVGTPELRLPLVRRALADAIAKEVHALARGALLLSDGGDAPARSVRYSEIFVLTRSASEGRDVAEAFRRHGVPHAFFKQDGLFRTREARDVLTVLRAVADRHDRSLATQALLGPFFGVPLGELAAAHAIDSGHPLARRLSRWAALADEGRVAALFSAMLDGAGPDGSGLSRRELYLHQGERALVNYRHLFELLLELATRRRLHVSELALALSARIDRAEDERAGSSDEDVQKLESERDAVQILTMHKSKGLEAEVVFVFGGLGKPPKRRLAPRVVHERLPGEERARRVAWALADDGLSDAEVLVRDGDTELPLRAALQHEAEEEDERLYYVALTRAKRRLYVPYFGRPPRPLPERTDVAYDLPHLKGSYRVLNDRLRALADAGELVAAPFAVTTVEVGPRVRARAAPVSLPEASARAVVERLAPQERARLVSRYAGFEVTSYTRMKSLARARADAEGRVVTSVELAPSIALLSGESRDERPGRAGPGGAGFGVLVHGVLEDILEAPPDVIDAASVAAHPAVRRRLELHAGDDEERTLALELATRALTVPLETPLLRLPDGVRALGRRAVEMPFLFPVPERAHPSIEALGAHEGGLVVERGFVRGVIDLLFEHEGRVFVLDWKTDRLEAYDEASMRAHVEEDYRVQIALYTLAALRVLARSGAHGDVESVHARFGGLIYVFVRGLAPAQPTGVLSLRPRLDEVLAWEAAARREDTLLGAPLPPRREPLTFRAERGPRSEEEDGA